METNTTNLTWEDNDGSIKHCLLIGNGRRFDAWYIFDAAGLDHGDDADAWRPLMRAPFDVQSPDGTHRRYATMSAAKRAVVKAAS